MKPRFMTGLAVALASSLVMSTALAQPIDTEPEDPADHAHDDPLVQERDGEAERDDEAIAPFPTYERTNGERTRVQAEPGRDVIIIDREEAAREREPQPIGLGFLVGGGVTGFGSDTMRDVTDIGGSWEARVAAGTRSPIGLELAYVGSAHGIDAIGLDADAILLGNGAEALARLNPLGEAPVQPYAFGGAGYRNYRVTNTDQNLSNLADSDNVFEVPVGGGINFRLKNGVLLDVRGTYRLAFDDDLTAADPPDDEPEVGSNLNSWGATLRLGYEF